MSKARSLHHLYDEWRRLTHAEREAIVEGRWQDLGSLQQSKLDLKFEIVNTTDAWSSECSPNAAWGADYEREFRPVVGELIRLEAANSQLLGDRVRAISVAIAETGQARRNLTGVRHVYGVRPEAAWHSYS